MFLKDHPNHLKALQFMRKYAPENPYVFEFFYYFLKLYELEPSAVKISLPGDRDPVEGNIIIAYYYPFEATDFDDHELPGDTKLELDIIEIDIKLPMFQKQAADYCGISVRTLQRWEKDGLPNMKIGRKKIYYEDDLISFMNELGHIRGLSRCGTNGYRDDLQNLLDFLS